MQNKNKIMVFYGILILFIISLFLSAEKYLDVAKYNKMNVIIETIPKNNNDILLKLDENIYAPKLFKNLLNQEIKTKVETIDILIKEKYSSKINNIIVFNDTKMNVYEDFSNFEKSKEKICVENKCTNYDKYKFNDEIKFDKNSKIINYNSKINTFYLFVVNFLGGNIVFLSSYILLFISIIYFINNKQYINIKLDYRFYAVACFLLAFFLRLNNIDSYAPWGDECYAVLISNPKMPFINIFNDPGNPPFYYFLLKMNLYLSNMSLLSARFLSVVFNLLAIGFLWYFVRKNFNKKMLTTK